MGIDGSALAMANEMDALDMGATAEPAPHPWGSTATDDGSVTTAPAPLGRGLAASLCSAATNSVRAASPLTAGTASYTISSASHAADAQSSGWAFCGSEPESASRPMPAA